MQSMEIERCQICGGVARIFFNIYSGMKYVSTDCDHQTSGPSCENDADAIRYWNAMMRGLKEEVKK